MAGKKKTTFAKINRENKLRERQAIKQMRKDQRKLEGPTSEEDSIGQPHSHVDLTADVIVDRDGRVVPVEQSV